MRKRHSSARLRPQFLRFPDLEPPPRAVHLGNSSGDAVAGTLARWTWRASTARTAGVTAAAATGAGGLGAETGGAADQGRRRARLPSVSSEPECERKI